jgi:signal transduction histidine kinase
MDSLTAAAFCAFREAREAFFLLQSSDERILEANPAAERLTGLTAADLRTRCLTDLLDAGVATSPSGSHVLTLGMATGERVGVRLRIRPVAADGEPLALAIIERLGDHYVPNLVKLREELIRQTRLATLGQMSASVAHDLRNPLGAVRNAAYYLRRKVPPTEPKWAEYIAIIEREVVLCDQIITNMLELSRSKEPAPELLDLGELVRSAFSQAKAPPEVQCHIHATAEPFHVRADPVQLRQVFDNLIKNSLDALAGRGDIAVEAGTEGDRCVIEYSDSGPGVSLDDRERLFEPLFTTKAKGSGLGLWIIRQVMECHGGAIDPVELPGRGLAFRISLPC